MHDVFLDSEKAFDINFGEAVIMLKNILHTSREQKIYERVKISKYKKLKNKLIYWKAELGRVDIRLYQALWAKGRS